MSKVMAAFARDLRENTGVWSLMHRPGDIENEFELIKYIWHTNAFQTICGWLDSFPTSKPGGFAYRRSTLFGFHVVALLLGLNLKEAHARVQSHDGLRRLFGLAERTAKFRKQQRSLLGRASLPEEGFPARSTVDDFTTRWLPSVAPELEEMVKQAYVVVALNAILEYELDPGKLAYDGARVQSARLYLRAGTKRPDVGARLWGREGEKKSLARLKMSALLVDTGIVIAAEVRTPTSEKARTREFLIPEVATRSHQLIELAASRSQKHPGFEGAAVAVDAQMVDNPIIGMLYDNNLRLASPTGGSKRELRGNRRLRGADGRHYVREVTEKQEILCRCDRYTINEETGEREKTPLDDRRAMLRGRGRASSTGGFVTVRCADPVCPFHKPERALHVAMRADDVVKDGRLVPGPRDLRAMLYLDNSDDRVSCIAFQGKQAIEAYHSCLQRFRLLGRKNGPGKRAISGDFKNDFYYTLADLIWNLTIAYHLKLGVERAAIDWETLNANRIRDDHKVAHYKSIGRGARVRRREAEDDRAPPDEPSEDDLTPPADLPFAA